MQGVWTSSRNQTIRAWLSKTKPTCREREKTRLRESGLKWKAAAHRHVQPNTIRHAGWECWSRVNWCIWVMRVSYGHFNYSHLFCSSLPPRVWYLEEKTNQISWAWCNITTQQKARMISTLLVRSVWKHRALMPQNGICPETGWEQETCLK